MTTFRTRQGNDDSAGRRHFLCRMNMPTPNRGFSLIELMIALTIGLLITAALANVMLASRVTYQADEGISRLQENGRIAMELITRELRSAGFVGCARNFPATTIYNNLNLPAGNIANLRMPVQGFEANTTGPGDILTPTTPTAVASAGWAPALDTNLVTLNTGGNTGAVPGTDVLVIRRASATGFPLVAPFPTSAPSSTLTIDSTVDPVAAADIRVGQIAVVSNCQQASIFQITGVAAAASTVTLTHDAGTTPGNSCANWNAGGTCAAGIQSYSSNARVYLVDIVVFFVGIDAANNNAPTLYRGTLQPDGAGGATIQAAPLVAGIENLQVLYGVDADGNRTPETVMTANTVNAGGAWPFVASVNVGLLARSENIVGDADYETTNQTYLLTGTNATTGTPVRTSGYADRRWRRAFNTTVTLRNRGI